MLSILIPHLDEFELPDNLRVDYSKFIINSLIKNYVINVLINWVPNLSKSTNTVLDNWFQKLINFWIKIWHLLHQNFQEFNYLRIVVINTEVQTIEKGHRVLLDVGIMFLDNVDNFII